MGVEEKESSSFQGRVSIWNSNGSIVTAPTTLLLVFFSETPHLSGILTDLTVVNFDFI